RRRNVRDWVFEHALEVLEPEPRDEAVLDALVEGEGDVQCAVCVAVVGLWRAQDADRRARAVLVQVRVPVRQPGVRQVRHVRAREQRIAVGVAAGGGATPRSPVYGTDESAE